MRDGRGLTVKKIYILPFLLCACAMGVVSDQENDFPPRGCSYGRGLNKGAAVHYILHCCSNGAASEYSRDSRG